MYRLKKFFIITKQAEQNEMEYGMEYGIIEWNNYNRMEYGVAGRKFKIR